MRKRSIQYERIRRPFYVHIKTSKAILRRNVRYKGIAPDSFQQSQLRYDDFLRSVLALIFQE